MCIILTHYILTNNGSYKQGRATNIIIGICSLYDFPSLILLGIKLANGYYSKGSIQWPIVLCEHIFAVFIMLNVFCK